jgi:hypothetical protein
MASAKAREMVPTPRPLELLVRLAGAIGCAVEVVNGTEVWEVTGWGARETNSFCSNCMTTYGSGWGLALLLTARPLAEMSFTFSVPRGDEP